MSPPSERGVGIVIGHCNALAFLELNLATIRATCGDVPVLIADDCSDGFERTPRAGSHFKRLLDLAGAYGSVVWPNVSRIGHTGGDMSAIWKGIVWGVAVRLDYVAKLSQRFVITRPGWLQAAAGQLADSGMPALGRPCRFHGWKIRTEAFMMRIEAWNHPDILAHLTPRPVAYPPEEIVWHDIRDWLGGKLAQWDLLSEARNVATAGVLFREANGPGDYARAAADVGLRLGPEHFDCSDASRWPGYRVG